MYHVSQIQEYHEVLWKQRRKKLFQGGDSENSLLKKDFIRWPCIELLEGWRER